MEYVCNGEGSIIKEIKAVKPEEYVEPEKADGVFEVTGYVMNDFERKAFTIFRRYRDEIEKLKEALETGRVKSGDMTRFDKDVELTSGKCLSVRDLMYFSIRDRLNIWNGPLGVSKGFKIIIPEEEIHPRGFAIAIPAGVLMEGKFDEAFSAAMQEIEEKEGSALSEIFGNRRNNSTQ